VIINLQRTQHDNKAAKSGGLVCHARCDDVMRLLVERLGLVVPPYKRRDAVIVGHQQHGPGKAGSGGGGRGSRGGASSAAGMAAEAGAAAGAETAADGRGSGQQPASGSGSSSEDEDVSRPIPFSVYVQSSHGAKCPMPMVQAVDFAFEVWGAGDWWWVVGGGGQGLAGPGLAGLLWWQAGSADMAGRKEQLWSRFFACAG